MGNAQFLELSGIMIQHIRRLSFLWVADFYVSLPIAWSNLHRVLGLWTPNAPLDNDDADTKIATVAQCSAFQLERCISEIKGCSTQDSSPDKYS
jgi:hypothetical protein